MKRIKLLPGLTIFLIAVACLIAVPAMSGENPWDSDGGGHNGTGSPADSSLLLDAGVLQSAQQSTTSSSTIVVEDAGWFNRLLVKVSSYIIEHYTEKTNKKAQLRKPAY